MTNPALPHMVRDGAAASFDRQRAPRSLWADALHRLVHNPGAVLGAAILCVIVLSALVAPWVVQYDPVAVTPGDRLQTPNAAHWFGTDAFGRDVFTRVLLGAQLSLQIGIVAVTISTVLGVSAGLLAGYYGGLIDTLIMRLVDVLLAFPGILLALVIVAVLGADLVNAMIAVGIAAAPTFARVTRGAVLQTKSQLFVDAAVVAGCSSARIMVRHILPNVLGVIVVVATLGVAGAIISGAALSFLGLGAKQPTPEWGLLLSDGRNYLRQAWWITTFPGLAIMLTVLSINLVGDALRDALDPRMQRS